MSGGRYSEALERQVEAAESVARAFREPGRVFPAETGVLSAVTRKEAHTRLQLDALVYGDPYFWARDLCDLVETGGPTLPDWTFRHTDLPGRRGFVWFERPLMLPAMRDDTARPLAAFAWTVAGYVYEPGLAGMDVRYHARPEPPEAVWLLLSYYVLDHGRCETTGMFALSEGESLAEIEKRSHPDAVRGPVTERWANTLARYAATSFVFLQQRLLVTTQERADRLARRRVAGRPEEEPLIRVVRLRRPQTTGEPDDQGPVEWSCRWITRGHWRQQPYPSTGGTRPIWIAPFLKGPPDKPLKPPRATVFAVVR